MELCSHYVASLRVRNVIRTHSTFRTFKHVFEVNNFILFDIHTEPRRMALYFVAGNCGSDICYVLISDLLLADGRRGVSKSQRSIDSLKGVTIEPPAYGNNMGAFLYIFA